MGAAFTVISRRSFAGRVSTGFGLGSSSVLGPHNGSCSNGTTYIARCSYADTFSYIDSLTSRRAGASRPGRGVAAGPNAGAGGPRESVTFGNHFLSVWRFIAEPGRRVSGVSGDRCWRCGALRRDRLLVTRFDRFASFVLGSSADSLNSDLQNRPQNHGLGMWELARPADASPNGPRRALSPVAAVPGFRSPGQSIDHSLLRL